MNEHDDSHALDLVTVFQSSGAAGEMQADAIQSLLEDSGIEAVLVGDSVLPNLPFEVRVAQQHEEEAKRLIADAEAGGPAAADEAEAATEI